MKRLLSLGAKSLNMSTIIRPLLIKLTGNLNRCPKCKGDNIYINTEHKWPLWGCGIGCYNANCPGGNELIIRYALSEGRAMRRAVKAWNKRCEHE